MVKERVMRKIRYLYLIEKVHIILCLEEMSMPAAFTGT